MRCDRRFRIEADAFDSWFATANGAGIERDQQSCDCPYPVFRLAGWTEMAAL